MIFFVWWIIININIISVAMITDYLVSAHLMKSFKREIILRFISGHLLRRCSMKTVLVQSTRTEVQNILVTSTLMNEGGGE